MDSSGELHLPQDVVTPEKKMVNLNQKWHQNQNNWKINQQPKYDDVCENLYFLLWKSVEEDDDPISPRTKIYSTLTEN